jgi:hypothetical protein
MATKEYKRNPKNLHVGNEVYVCRADGIEVGVIVKRLAGRGRWLVWHKNSDDETRPWSETNLERRYRPGEAPDLPWLKVGALFRISLDHYSFGDKNIIGIVDKVDDSGLMYHPQGRKWQSIGLALHDAYNMQQEGRLLPM